MFDPEITRDGELVPQFEWGRGAPSSIVVNRKGARFANEALPYNDFPKAFGVYDPDAVEFPNAGPAFLVFDRSVRDQQRILSMHPGRPRSGLGATAPDTIGELADDDRRRPRRARGDGGPVQRARRAAVRTPTSVGTKVGLMSPGTVAPIEQPPFYAVEMYPGMLGTNGGPQIDADGQVRRLGGGVVDGLYAAGNTAANVFGWAYPSGGGTLGNGWCSASGPVAHAGARPARTIS